MKSKMRKKLIAFMLCMVLVICNSVSILADAPAAATTTTEKQVKETGTAKSEDASEEEKSADDEKDTSEQSDEESAPETETTEKKEETTEATTEDKEDATTEATTEAEEGTSEAAESSDKDETTGAEEKTSETAKKEETAKTTEEKTTAKKDDTTEAETTDKNEAAPAELTYEDNDVKVTVSAVAENAIPEGTTLKVKPVVNSGETAEQYEQVEKQLEEQKTEENTTVAGFLAYDISLFTEEGIEIEPNGEVKVDIDYKEASIADIKQGIVEADSDIDQNKDLDVTVLHLEENQDGSVKDVVDLSKQNKIETLETTEEQKVQKISFSTSSFSIYCVTWQENDGVYEVEVGEQIELRSTNSGYWPNWISSDGEVASVNGHGNEAVVTGNKPREVTITYTYYTWNTWDWEYEKYTETCTVIVKDSGGSGSQGGSGTVVTEKELSHEKYILYNSEDDTYNLTLNVSGAVGTETQKAPMDILFIMDTSNSMKWSMSDPGTNQDTFLDDYRTNSNSRFYNQQKAVRDAVQAIEDKGTIDARYAVVSFDTLAGTEQSWTESSNIDFPSKVANYPEGNGWNDQEAGGTNYEAALEEAKKLLDSPSARKEADKVIVFLSDGDVTFYNATDGHGNEYVGGSGQGYSSEGMKQAKEVLGTLDVNYFYTVGVGPSESYEHLSELREGAPAGTVKDNFDGENADDLKEAFEDIIAQVTDLLCTNVVVTDTLSSYVEPVEGTGLTIEVRDGNGNVVDTPEGITARYVDQDGKTQIQFRFPSDYQLESGYTYFVTAKIKATDFAYTQYQQNGNNYGDMRGDEYTDENTNPSVPGYTSNSGTSSNQQGFYANDDAIVEYVYNGKRHTEYYKKPVIQISEDKLDNLEPVNFYLNLSSKILDTIGNVTGQDNGDFTTSVSGTESAEVSDQGIGVEINTGLRVKVPDDHDHSKVSVYPVIGSDSSVNAKNADEKIRSLVNGTSDTLDGKYYQIVDINGNNNEDEIFPTDGEIFEYIRKNWGDTVTEEGQNAKCVNKGKYITLMDGKITVDKDNLTEENFAIRWYVFKDQSDYWHIDGILVPKSGILNITKTFPNEEIANQLASTFKVEVTGNFLEEGTSAGITSGTTLEETLADATKVANADGTVTYTWPSITVFGKSYEVQEVGYTTNSNQWEYTGTDFTYTNANGQTITGNTTSTTIATSRDAEDGETTPVQTLEFSNYYDSNNEDDNPYILVSKTFKGLSFEQIEKLYKDFTLTVTNTLDSSDSKELHLDDENVTVSPESTDKGKIQDYTFTWKVEDCTTGTYRVEENGETVGKYVVATEGNGNQVDVSGAIWKFDDSEVEIRRDCSELSFAIGNNRILMASLSGNNTIEGQKVKYVIWTYESLTVAQRDKIIQTINDNGKYQPFRTGEATAENCKFYSGYDLNNGISVGKGTITYIQPTGGEQAGTIKFSGQSVWSHVAAGSYSMTNTQNADIAVTNTYTANLDLKKVSAATSNPEIDGAKFKISKWNTTNSAWELVGQEITVNESNLEAELTGLVPGTIYKLEETKAPNAHVLLGEAIYFKAVNGKVVLCNQSGVEITTSSNDMYWMDSNGVVLTIKNNILYDLPSAGGSGIYWYTFSGALLMMGAALIVYRKKRKREVLLRK